MTFRLANSLNLFFSFANSFWFFNHSFWCFSCGLCLYFVSLCPEVFLQRPGVASLVGWSSSLSHTCSSSNHQHQLKYSGLPSTWWQIVSTHPHWCLWLQQLVLISCNFFALVILRLNHLSNFLKCFHCSPLSCHKTNSTVDPPATNSPVPPPRPLPSSGLGFTTCCAARLSHYQHFHYNTFSWTNQ